MRKRKTPLLDENEEKILIRLEKILKISFSIVDFMDDNYFGAVSVQNNKIVEIQINGIYWKFPAETFLFTENQINECLEIICSLRHLTKIQINTGVLKSIPSNLGILSQLTELDLMGNLLDTIPDSILACKKLKWLNVLNNPITFFPERISELVSLESLWLDYEHISLIFPFVDKMPNLKRAGVNREELYLLKAGMDNWSPQLLISKLESGEILRAKELYHPDFPKYYAEILDHIKSINNPATQEYRRYVNKRFHLGKGLLLQPVL